MSQLATENAVRTVATRAQGAPTAVLVTDANGRVLGASKPMCALLGWRRIELLLLGLPDVGIAEAVFTGIRAQAEVHGLAVGTALLHHRDGTPTPVQYHVTRIDLADGPIYHWIVQPRRSPRPKLRGGLERRRAARALRITERELEVVQLIANGLGNREIALQLSVSLETVKTHIRRVLGKLGARGRAHAVAIAWRKNLVD